MKAIALMVASIAATGGAINHFTHKVTNEADKARTQVVEAKNGQKSIVGLLASREASIDAAVEAAQSTK